MATSVLSRGVQQAEGQKQRHYEMELRKNYENVIITYSCSPVLYKLQLLYLIYFNIIVSLQTLIVSTISILHRVLKKTFRYGTDIIKDFFFSTF